MTAMREQYTDGSVATLGSNMGSGDSTMTVLSMTPAAPTTGKMRIQIESERILITDLSASPWPITRGIEGTSAASHVSGSKVTQVLTAGGLDNILSVLQAGSRIATGRDINFTSGATITLDGDGSTIDIAISGAGPGEVTGTDFKATGVTGTTVSARFVGGGASGHPTSGTFVANDFVINADGTIWICTIGGTPGTWVQVGTTSATFAGEVTGTDFKATGLTGATATSRHVGATASGAPVSGTFILGDFIIDQTGKLYICTVAGTPGTWAAVGTGLSNPMSAIGDIIVGTTGGSPARLAIGSAGQILQVVGGTAVWGAAPTAFSGEVTAQDFKPTGLTGAGQASRLVGATASGAPGSGTFVTGDTVIDQSGAIWICTAGGSPGTWKEVGSVISGEISVTDLKVTGLTGATAASRLVGATTSGAPVSGTFLKGDVAVDQTGSIWVCTTAGSPGSWTQVSGGGLSNPMTTAGDIITGGSSGTPQRLAGGTNGQVLQMVSGTPAWGPASVSSTLAGDTDVSITSPAGSDHLLYQTSDSKWHNRAEVLNMLAYGADPTGTSDSSAAFLAAVADIQAHGYPYGAVIFFPPGTYKWTSDGAIDYSSTGNVQISIVGRGATIKPANSVTVFHPHDSLGNWQMFNCDGMIFDGTSTTGVTFIKIENMVQGARVANCTMGFGANGVYVLNSGATGNFCETVTIENHSHFGATTAGITFTRTGGDISQGQFLLSNVNLSECSTGVFFDGGVLVYRGRMHHVTIWTTPGQLGINMNNADFNYNWWEVYFEGFSGGGNNIQIGSSASNTDTMRVQTGFLNVSIPGLVNSSNKVFQWWIGPKGYSFGTSQQVWAANSGDTQPRIQSDMGFAGGGGFHFGPGSSTATDVTLFRKLASVLATNSAFLIGSFATAGLPSASSAGAGAIAWVTDATGGAQFMRSDGSIWANLLPSTSGVRWEPLVNDSASSPVDFIYTNGDVVVVAD